MVPSKEVMPLYKHHAACITLLFSNLDCGDLLGSYIYMSSKHRFRKDNLAQVFSLLSLARRISLSLPRLTPLLPEELRRKLEAILDACVREAQNTFREYRITMQGGIQRQTGGSASSMH